MYHQSKIIIIKKKEKKRKEKEEEDRCASATVQTLSVSYPLIFYSAKLRHGTIFRFDSSHAAPATVTFTPSPVSNELILLDQNLSQSLF
jgi:hypothetical protein